jgi:hypothetical protein
MLDKLNPGAGLCTKSALTSIATAVPPAAPAWPALKITGQNIAKGRRTRAQRIALAEHLKAGLVELSKPTMKQAAALAGIPVAEIYRARKARKPKPMPTLAEQILAASPVTLIETARNVGVDLIWDRMVAPLVGGRPNGTDNSGGRHPRTSNHSVGADPMNPAWKGA